MKGAQKFPPVGGLAELGSTFSAALEKKDGKTSQKYANLLNACLREDIEPLPRWCITFQGFSRSAGSENERMRREDRERVPPISKSGRPVPKMEYKEKVQTISKNGRLFIFLRIWYGA